MADGKRQPPPCLSGSLPLISIMIRAVFEGARRSPQTKFSDAVTLNRQMGVGGGCPNSYAEKREMEPLEVKVL